MQDRSLLVTVVAAAFALPVAAQDAASLQAAVLAAGCAQCHGTNGHPVAGTTAPLASQPSERFLQAMRAFRSGTRPSTVMGQIARGYSDADLQALAGYFAVQPR